MLGGSSVSKTYDCPECGAVVLDPGDQEKQLVLVVAMLGLLLSKAKSYLEIK